MQLNNDDRLGIVKLIVHTDILKTIPLTFELRAEMFSEISLESRLYFSLKTCSGKSTFSPNTKGLKMMQVNKKRDIPFSF